MKHAIALIILIALINSSFASNKEFKSETDLAETQTNKSDESIKIKKTDYFDSLNKPNSRSKNVLGIDQNKAGTEICGIEGSGGTGVCGVPEDAKKDETESDSDKKPT